MHVSPLQALILDRRISLADAIRVIDRDCSITLSASAVSRCAEGQARVGALIAESRHVYGITTGFGPLANRLIDAAERAILQQNLVYHLATGVGPAFGWREARAIVLARLMSILQGCSGASDQAIAALLALVNSDFAPNLPSKGTVGASGDLTPLAHMVLCFQGAADFMARDGTSVSAQTVLSVLNIAPLHLSDRDGLALVNGTSAMTGVAVLNVAGAERSLRWACALTAALAETQSGRVEAWDAAFGQMRPHPGQIAVAQDLQRRLAGSSRVRQGYLSDRRLTGVMPVTEPHAGQDAYTLRCAPQVIGAVRDVSAWHARIVETELNAVTDNPIFPENGDGLPLALHGGNFMGQHIGLASDALANAVVVLAGLAERQVARLTDESLNRGLPAFLHRGPAGLNSGFMGAQVTATAVLAELRCIGSASVQSISTNGANQDVVSMGTIAARLLAEKLAGLRQIQAILALCVVQAMDIVEQEDSHLPFSAHALALRRLIRTISPELHLDRPMSAEIATVSQALSLSDPPAV